MTERPILFSAPMVRALIEGRKTQTRRVVRELPGNRGGLVGDHVKWFERGNQDHTRWCGHDGLGSLGWVTCPFGEPGDRLWCKETWWTAKTFDDKPPRWIAEMALDAGYSRPWGPVRYSDETDNGLIGDFGGEWGKVRPSIFMPRWASRITLEITEVRVQRLAEISEDDARAEGVERTRFWDNDDVLENDRDPSYAPPLATHVGTFTCGMRSTARGARGRATRGCGRRHSGGCRDRPGAPDPVGRRAPRPAQAAPEVRPTGERAVVGPRPRRHRSSRPPAGAGRAEVRERPSVSTQRVWRANGRRFLTAWAAYYEIAKSLLAKKYPRWLDDEGLEDELPDGGTLGAAMASADGIRDWKARRDRRRRLFWITYRYHDDAPTEAGFDEIKWRRYVTRVARRFMAADRRKTP